MRSVRARRFWFSALAASLALIIATAATPAALAHHSPGHGGGPGGGGEEPPPPTVDVGWIYYYGFMRMGRKPGDCWELYDLRDDPHERFNVYDKPEHKDMIASLKSRLSELRRQEKDTNDPLRT